MAALRIVGCLVAVLFCIAGLAFGSDDQTTTDELGTPAEELTIAEDLELFRQQMLDYLQRMDSALSSAMRHPALVQRVESALAANMLQIPFAPSTYAAFENATHDELTELREALVQVPGVLTIPEVVNVAVQELPQPEDNSYRAAQAVCDNNYMEYMNAISKQGAVRALTRTLDITAFFFSGWNTFTEVVGAATEDTPYVGKIPSLPLVIIRGIFDVVRLAIGFASDDLSFQDTLSQLCVASCLADVDDVPDPAAPGLRPSARWRGRGCDNRDNNCVDGIDENTEDRFAPEVAVDAAVLEQCFADTMAAQTAANLAVKATDDCSDPTFNVTLGAVSPATCKAGFSVMARDQAGNATSLSGAHLQLTVDGQPPQVTVPALDACYPTVEAARNAFTGPGLVVSDCNDVDLAVGIVEKECVADLELTAVDSCGNQTAVRSRARVDANPPEIDIGRLEIPSIDGLSCFESQTDAITAVTEATMVADRCTAAEDLTRSTTATGPECDLEVTASAEDECGLANSDSLVVRVDAQVPEVSCAVATSILFPVNEQLVDVGFVYRASDNCEPNGPRTEVTVTSDEATALAYSAVPGVDPFPDAVVERAADGSVQRILLRAQRSTVDNADGRAYRIRVTATDSCGLQSTTDCWVTVPRTKPGPGSAINSGQQFDATVFN